MTPKSLWNKFKQVTGLESLFGTLKITESDIVVFVVGPTGSGKSWFAKTVTKCDAVQVSKKQHPFTGKLQAIRCEPIASAGDGTKTELQGVNTIIFVDTPSFLTGCDDFDPHKEFEAWFGGTVYKPGKVGMIYMHRVETNPNTRSTGTFEEHLRELAHVPQLLSHPSLPRRLHVVISHDTESSNIDDSQVKQRTFDLSTQVNSLQSKSTDRWKLSMHKENFRGDARVAWEAVEELFRSETS